MLKPDHDPSPMKTSEPIPAARRPGSSTSGRIGPPSPVASMMSTAPITGEPKIDETAAKLPAAAIRPSAWSRRVPLDQPHREHSEPEAERDQGPLRPEHEPEPERRERREQHTRQVDRPRSACRPP